MTLEAKLVQCGAHRVWRCPCCDTTLGEVYDDRVTVRTGGRLIMFAVTAPVEQVCPKCGTSSAMPEPVAA